MKKKSVGDFRGLTVEGSRTYQKFQGCMNFTCRSLSSWSSRKTQVFGLLLSLQHSNNLLKILLLFWGSENRVSWQILIITPNRCTNFSKFIFGIKLYIFRTVPLSIIRSFSLYTQHWYMSYSLRARSGRNLSRPGPARKLSAKPGWHTPINVCTEKNSWWWTEELSETCRVLFQK